MPVYLAAYGTLMTGNANGLPAVQHRMIPKGPCLIPGRLIQFRDPEDGNLYPALIPAPNGQVMGKLFTLRAADLRLLDTYEDFHPTARWRSFYIRRLLTVQARFGPVRAWVYVWNPSAAGLGLTLSRFRGKLGQGQRARIRTGRHPA